MIDEGEGPDLGLLVVARVGHLEETGDAWAPYRLVDPEGRIVGPVAAFLKDLQAAGRSSATLRSYGMDLLRWLRFLWAVEVLWDQATRVEARDYSLWIQIGGKPVVRHWRRRSDGVPIDPMPVAAPRPAPKRVTGKAAPGRTYAPATGAHGESVLRGFYDFHAEAGTGPMVNPFPLARAGRRGRANAHHSPMDPHRRERVGRYRPKLAARPPRCIPDALFNELFAGWVRQHLGHGLLDGRCCGQAGDCPRFCG